MLDVPVAFCNLGGADSQEQKLIGHAFGSVRAALSSRVDEAEGLPHCQAGGHDAVGLTAGLALV